MEERIVVLCSIALVVTRVFTRRWLVFVFAVRVVKCRGREGSAFDGGAEGSLAHVAAGFGLLSDETMFVVVATDLGVAIAVRVSLSTEGEAVGCGTGGSIGDGHKGDDCADDDGGFAGAAGADERVALVVVGFHADCGHGEVGAVYCYDGGLGQAGAGVYVLDGGVDGDYGGDEEHKEIDLERLAE